MGPNHNLTKQSSPVSALRKYYNSEVPRAYKKNKSPSSWSPSVEPTEQAQTLTDPNRNDTNKTNPQSPQEPNAEHTVRPITLTNSATPKTDTTPQPNQTQKHNQAEVNELIMAEMEETEHAMEIAADANLNYIKISKHMCNVLQDVEDIMLNQMSDIFQLKKWVANVANILGLKVCNEEDWKMNVQ